MPIQFDKVYANYAQKYGRNPDPDDPRHHYDYRRLFAETGKIQPDETGHLPSKYKTATHPNRFVSGIDTITGKKALAKWNEIQDSNKYQSLGVQEQMAVQQRYYDNVISKDADFRNLSQTEQIATKTKFFSQGPMGRQQQNNIRQQQLIEQMRGSLPLSQQKLTGLSIQKEALIADPQKQRVFDELQQMGLTPEQIKFAIEVNKRIETPPTLGRTAGGIAGAIGLPLALNLIPGFAALPEEAVTIPLALAKAGRAVAPIIGAGLGGGAGEAAQVALEEKRLVNRGEFLKAFATEAAFEFGGRAFVRAGKFAFSPFIKRTIPEAAALVDDFAKVGGVLPPTALDKRFTLSVAEEISRGAFGARQVFEEMGQKTGRAARVYADQLLDLMADGTMRLGTEQLGSEFAAGITRPRGRIFRMLDDLFTPLYKQVDELTKGVTVSTGKLKALAKTEIAKDTRLNKLILSPQGRSKLQKIIGMSDEISFGDMRDLRSSFLGDVRKLARDVSKDEGLIKRIAGLTDDALFDPSAAGPGLSEEARRLLQNTNRLYRTSREALETTFSQKLADRITRNPVSVIKELFPNNPTAIKNLRIALEEPISGRPSAEGKALWRQLRTAWFDDAVEKATREEIVKPHVFENALRPYIRTGALKEMIPDKKGMQQLQTIRDLLVAMSKKPAAGASLFIRGGQVGGLFMMYQGAKDGDFLQITAGGALVSGPYFFAKLAAHPLGSRLLASGVKLKPGSTSLVPITARLVNLARKIDRETLITRQREKRQKPFRGFGGRAP